MENLVTFEHEKTTKIMLYWKLQKNYKLGNSDYLFSHKKGKVS